MDSLELVSHYIFCFVLLHFTTTGIPMSFITIFMIEKVPTCTNMHIHELNYDMHIYELCMGFYSTSSAFDLYGCSGTSVAVLVLKTLTVHAIHQQSEDISKTF